MLSFIQPMILWLNLFAFSLASPLPQEASLKNRRSFVERDGINFTVFEHAATGARMEFVTNSGICETTPGVNQYSGYLSVGTNQNMWFWLYGTSLLMSEPNNLLTSCVVLRRVTIQILRLSLLGSMVDQGAPV